MDEDCADERWLDGGDGLENTRPLRRKTVHNSTSSRLCSLACLGVGWGYDQCVVREWLCHGKIRQKNQWEYKEGQPVEQVHDGS